MKIGWLSLFIACATGLFSFIQSEKTKEALQSTHQNLLQVEDAFHTKMESLEKDRHLTQEQPPKSLIAPELNNLSRFEIETFIHLAATQLNATQDLPATLRLLNAAQSKIQALQDPQLDPLTQALQHDVQTLQALQPSNTPVAWQTLAALIDQTHTLLPRQKTLNHSTPSETPQTSPTPPTTQALPAWQSFLYESLHALKDLIKIRHHTKPLEPLLSETEQQLIRQQLRLLLEELRLSALMRNKTLYGQLIKDTRQWIESYYDRSDPKILSLQQSLQDLEKLSLENVPSLTCVNQLAVLRS